MFLARKRETHAKCVRVCRYTAATMIRFIGSSFLHVKSPVKHNHYWPVVAAAVVVPYALY